MSNHESEPDSSLKKYGDFQSNDFLKMTHVIYPEIPSADVGYESDYIIAGPRTESLNNHGFFYNSFGSSRSCLSSPNDRMLRRRRRLLPEESDLLNRVFEANQRPNSSVRERLASRLGMTSRGIQIWFQNRRAKVRRDEVEGKEMPVAKATCSASSASDESLAIQGDVSCRAPKFTLRQLEEIFNSPSPSFGAVYDNADSSCEAIAAPNLVCKADHFVGTTQNVLYDPVHCEQCRHELTILSKEDHPHASCIVSPPVSNPSPSIPTENYKLDMPTLPCEDIPRSSYELNDRLMKEQLEWINKAMDFDPFKPDWNTNDSLLMDFPDDKIPKSFSSHSSSSMAA